MNEMFDDQEQSCQLFGKEYEWRTESNGNIWKIPEQIAKAKPWTISYSKKKKFDVGKQ